MVATLLPSSVCLLRAAWSTQSHVLGGLKLSIIDLRYKLLPDAIMGEIIPPHR